MPTELRSKNKRGVFSTVLSCLAIGLLAVLSIPNAGLVNAQGGTPTSVFTGTITTTPE